MNGKRGVLAALVSTALITGLVGQLPPASAAKKKKKIERTETRQYIGSISGAVAECPGEPVGCVVFPVEPGERYVSLEIVDQSGQSAHASVFIYGYSDGTDTHEHICGASEAPLRLMPGLEELVVIPTQGTGGLLTDPCAGLTTVGNVTATFSNIP